MNRYLILDVIGSGSYGTAYLCKNRKSGDLYVVKQIDIRGMQSDEIAKIQNEVFILSNMKHEFIVHYHNCFKEQGNFFIVMAYCAGGDIQKLIKSNKDQPFPIELVYKWFVQAALALFYLNRKKVIHRDLKPQNIFLDRNYDIKVGDFGISRILQRTQDVAQTVVGTPLYVAPEVIDHKTYNNKVDIWSMGCMFYEILTLHHPFTPGMNDRGKNSVFDNIRKGRYPKIGPEFDPDLKHIIEWMLTVDPEKRPSIQDILEYPAIKSRVEKYYPKYIESIENSDVPIPIPSDPPSLASSSLGSLPAKNNNAGAQLIQPPAKNNNANAHPLKERYRKRNNPQMQHSPDHKLKQQFRSGQGNELKNDSTTSLQPRRISLPTDLNEDVDTSLAVCAEKKHVIGGSRGAIYKDSPSIVPIHRLSTSIEKRESPRIISFKGHHSSGVSPNGNARVSPPNRISSGSPHLVESNQKNRISMEKMNPQNCIESHASQHNKSNEEEKKHRVVEMKNGDKEMFIHRHGSNQPQVVPENPRRLSDPVMSVDTMKQVMIEVKRKCLTPEDQLLEKGKPQKEKNRVQQGEKAELQSAETNTEGKQELTSSSDSTIYDLSGIRNVFD